MNYAAATAGFQASAFSGGAIGRVRDTQDIARLLRAAQHPDTRHQEPDPGSTRQ